MSSVKRLLRSARECLGRKEYREALQHCKEALAEDKSCYEAYVFVGKAAFSLGEAPQAQAAYRRAADLDPANPLAWQGLAELAADTALVTLPPSATHTPSRVDGYPLAADTEEIEARVAVRLAEEAAALAATTMTPEQAAALEAAVRGGVEGEWAEEALEADADHASASLRAIIALRPPAPPYVNYYNAFLKRLRKYIQAAAPGSMDRHARRAVLLAAAKATMEGRCGDRAGSDVCWGIVKLLLSALSRGARGVAGWLAACELLLEEGAEEAALDAAKEGLKLVAHRELLLLEGLAHGVSEGHVAAGELAGLPPVNVSQQAKRLLAHVAAARGDLAACRHVFEELALQREAATYHLHLALALWAKGGGSLGPAAAAATAEGAEEAGVATAEGGGVATAGWAEPYRSECREHLLSAAAVAGPLQAAAFTWLGHWYVRAAATAGAATAGGGGDAAATAAPPPQHLHPQHLHPLPRAAPFTYPPPAGAPPPQAEAGEALSALRLSPDDAELWEGLASAYQALGRHTAALKSYGRALDLAPGRLYCRLQAAALSYQMGDMPAALAQYRGHGCAHGLQTPTPHPTKPAAPQAAWKLLGDPLLPAAHHARGLALEARGDFAAAAECVNHWLRS
eukprot:XP_001700535.1 predicted protein [Chlamydomonas reinhardtii]